MLTAFQESDQIKDALPDMPTLENAKTIYGKKIKAGNNKKIAVKIVDNRGIESLIVRELS